MTNPSSRRAFSLIETLIAIVILTVSIVAPMALATQAITNAYYARDQVTAANLAQEAVETVRASRDGNVLRIAKTTNTSGINLFDPLTINHYYLVDPTMPVGSLGSAGTSMFVDCGLSVCTTKLKTNGTLYGYNAVWTPSVFTRYIHVMSVSGTNDEIHIDSIVTWRTGSLNTRTFIVSENLFRWVADGTAMP